MNFKIVMVSLALDCSNYACLSVAGDLAERFGARSATIVDPCAAADPGDLAEWILGA